MRAGPPVKAGRERVLQGPTLVPRLLEDMEGRTKKPLKPLKRRSFQTFVSRLLLPFLGERTLVATGDPNYVPSAILLGSFLGPVTFTTYLYERLPNWEVPLPPVAICFVWGGVPGTVVAGTLEYDAMKRLGFLPKEGIGVIEEGAKLILPLVFYFLGRYRSEAAGILLGVATAMVSPRSKPWATGLRRCCSRRASWACWTRCSWCAG